MSRLAGVLALALLLAAPASADVVELTNGNEVKGEVIDEAADPVIVKTPDGKLSFPKRMVKKITREDAIRLSNNPKLFDDVMPPRPQGLAQR